jgi:hypothetical protein
MTAHNQWLSTTRSIPYWTTSVFSSTVTNDERRIPSDWAEWRMTTHLWTNSFQSVLTCPSFITSGEPNRDHHVKELVAILSVVLCHGNMLTEPLPSRWTAAYVRCYSGSQAVFTEPLHSDGHIGHNIHTWSKLGRTNCTSSVCVLFITD